MVCLAPRAPGDSVRPRRSSDVVVRPLNFTVRSHFGEIKRREEQGTPSFGGGGARALADTIDLQASSFDASECTCGRRRL